MIVRFRAGIRDVTRESKWRPASAPATVGALLDALLDAPRERYGESFAARPPVGAYSTRCLSQTSGPTKHPANTTRALWKVGVPTNA